MDLYRRRSRNDRQQAGQDRGGVLFSSNPHGQNEEGWNRGRYGAYHDLEAWRRYMLDAAFIELEYYYRPTGLPREQQPWLASVWRRAPPQKIGTV